ncbi:MAG: class I SAM-dependent methyltransferase [Anaeromyxobacter sp.]|nr:class I SAM-dependent methyltransferase [Anaeromyxobacter sp.]
MSRRAISVEDDARWVFNRLAADYAARPGYPDELVARLLRLAGGPGARVAELGAGTGLLALPLARSGARVHAVEPARAMLEVLEGTLRAGVGAGSVVPVHATAEATGLPAGAFDLVVLADALHWVSAEQAGREAARLLAPGGTLAVVAPRLARTPFLEALSARLAAANPKARPGPPPVARLLGAAGLGAPATERFQHQERLSPERLEQVLRSLSLVGPALGPAGLAALLADARALAEAHGGADWRRELELHWARRR